MVSIPIICSSGFSFPSHWVVLVRSLHERADTSWCEQTRVIQADVDKGVQMLFGFPRYVAQPL